MKTAPSIDMTAVLSSDSNREPKRHRSNPDITRVESSGYRRSPNQADQSNVMFSNLLSQQNIQSGCQQPVAVPPQGNLFALPNTAGNQQILGLGFDHLASHYAPLSLQHEKMPSSSFATPFSNILEPPREHDESSLTNEDMKMSAVDDDKVSTRTTTSLTTDGDGETITAEAEADSLVNDKTTLDNEEFAEAVGPDENFFGLGSSDPIGDVDIFEDQL